MSIIDEMGAALADLSSLVVLSSPLKKRKRESPGSNGPPSKKQTIPLTIEGSGVNDTPVRRSVRVAAKPQKIISDESYSSFSSAASDHCSDDDDSYARAKSDYADLKAPDTPQSANSQIVEDSASLPDSEDFVSRSASDSSESDSGGVPEESSDEEAKLEVSPPSEEQNTVPLADLLPKETEEASTALLAETEEQKTAVLSDTPPKETKEASNALSTETEEQKTVAVVQSEEPLPVQPRDAPKPMPESGAESVRHSEQVNTSEEAVACAGAANSVRPQLSVASDQQSHKPGEVTPSAQPSVADGLQADNVGQVSKKTKTRKKKKLKLPKENIFTSHLTTDYERLPSNLFASTPPSPQVAPTPVTGKQPSNSVNNRPAPTAGSGLNRPTNTLTAAQRQSATPPPRPVPASMAAKRPATAAGTKKGPSASPELSVPRPSSELKNGQTKDAKGADDAAPKDAFQRLILDLLAEYKHASKHQGVVDAFDYSPKKLVTALVGVLERVHLEGISLRIKTEKGGAVLQSLCHGSSKYYLSVPVPAVVYKPKQAPRKEGLGPKRTILGTDEDLITTLKTCKFVDSVYKLLIKAEPMGERKPEGDLELRDPVARYIKTDQLEPIAVLDDALNAVFKTLKLAYRHF